MTDPNQIVEARTKNGSIVYMSRRSARAWGHTINENAKKTTDGHGKPLPAKPKKNLPKATDTGKKA